MPAASIIRRALVVAGLACAEGAWRTLAEEAPMEAPMPQPADSADSGPPPTCPEFDCAAIYDPTFVGDYSGFNFQDFKLLFCGETQTSTDCPALALESPQAAKSKKEPQPGPAGDPNFVGPGIGLYIELNAPKKTQVDGKDHVTPGGQLGIKQISVRSCPSTAPEELWFGEAAQRDGNLNFTFYLRPQDLKAGCGYGKLRMFPSCSPESVGGSGGPFGSKGPTTPVGLWQVREEGQTFDYWPIEGTWAKFVYQVPKPFDSGVNCLYDTINFINENDANSKCDYQLSMDDATFESDCIRPLPPTEAPTASPTVQPSAAPTPAPTAAPTNTPAPSSSPITIPTAAPTVFVEQPCCQQLPDADRYTFNYTAGFCISRGGQWAPGCPSPALTGFGSAEAQCKSVGLELCTLEEAFSSAVGPAGCPGLDTSRDNFWTSTPCSTPGGGLSVQGYFVMQGDGSRYDCALPSYTEGKVMCCSNFCPPAEDSLKCCAEIEGSPWPLDREVGVCSSSRISGISEDSSCNNDVTWAEANSKCRSVGAMMCTTENAFVGAETGCNTEDLNIWTGEPCTTFVPGSDVPVPGYYQIRGSGEGPPYCNPDLEQPNGLRCCADACPLAASTSTP